VHSDRAHVPRALACGSFPSDQASSRRCRHERLPPHHLARCRFHRHVLHDDAARAPAPYRVHTGVRLDGSRGPASPKWDIPSGRRTWRRRARPGHGPRRRALANDLHKKAVLLAADAGQSGLCTKPLARTAPKHWTSSRPSRRPACSPGTSRTWSTPQDTEVAGLRARRRAGRVLWVRSRETHRGRTARGSGTRRWPARAIVDMGCHCSRSSETSSART